MASCLSLPLPHSRDFGWALGAQTAQRATKALTSHLKHTKGFPSPHGRQVPHHYIQGLDGLKRDTRQPARESIMQSLQTHTGHPLYSHLKYSVLPFSWQRDLQLHLQQCQTTNQDDSFHWKGGKAERGSEGTMHSSERRHRAGVETKSKDEATAHIKYSLFLQLHLPKGLFQKPGVPPSWHLSPLWGNTAIWRCLYQRGGLSRDAITWFQIPNMSQCITACVSSCMPKIQHGLSPPAKIHEFLVFALKSTRVLYRLLLQTQFKREKKGALKEKKSHHQPPKQNKKPTKPTKPKLLFLNTQERINYNPEYQWRYQAGNGGTSLPYFEFFI